jgi:hypothetical protein
VPSATLPGVRRLLIALIVIAVLVLGGMLAGVVIAKPLLEERLAERIGDEVGAPVEVQMDLDRVPGGLAGRVGDVLVTAPRIERQGIELVDLQVTIDEADVAMLELARGTAKVDFEGVQFQVGMREEAIQEYVAERLAAAGVPGAQALQIRVTPDPEGVYATIPGIAQVRMLVRVVGADRIRLEVQGKGAAAQTLREVLPQAIDVGPLPLDLRLTGITYGQGVAFVQGERGPGTETFE